jgi:hypothetical protein
MSEHRSILARDAKAGMTRCFDNPRNDYLIDQVEFTGNSEVKLHTGGLTGIDWIDWLVADDVIWVKD